VQQPPVPPPPFTEPPWSPLELGSVTDVIGIFLGLIVLGITVYIFFRQLKIMNRQTELAEKQLELAEKQDRILELELSKKTDLRIIAPSQHRSGPTWVSGREPPWEEPYETV